MDPVFQRLGDVTIQRLEKPKDKMGLQGNGDIMEKESKEERTEQNIHINSEDSQGIKRIFENVAGPSTKRTKFERQHLDLKRALDESSMNSFISEPEFTDYDTDSEIESDEDMLHLKSHNSNIESATSELDTSTDFLEKLVQEPFDEHDSDELKSADEIKTEVDDYEYDIKEKLKEMGEISFETVKKGEKLKKTEVATENEVVVTPAKKIANIEEDPMGDRFKSSNLRRNIREVMDETKLDESTLAAQRQEMERLRRVQEQQRIIREVQRQMAQDRVISLLQGGNVPKASTSGARIGNTVLVKLPNGQTKTMTKLGKKPFDLVKVPKSVIPPTKTKSLIAIKKPPGNLTPSVSIAPVMKRTPPQHFPTLPSDESDSEGEEISAMLRRPMSRPKPKDPVATIDISSDDDCIVVSESENDPSDEVDEDPSNSGMHTNDEFNQPDGQGRVVVNIGHPDGEPDIYLAPQIARIIKPHQIGGIRFLFDNVIESLNRYETSSGFGCILAHSMGLGKTLQVVSFTDIFLRNTFARTILCIMPINTLQNWMAEYNMWLPTEDAVTNSPLNAHGEVRPRNFNLLVLNDSHKTLATRAKVISEWKNGGGVLLIGYEQYRLLSMRKHPKSRRKTVQQEPVDDDKNKKLFDDVHVALVEPGPDLVICDEGHRIKNSHASISLALKQMRTKRRVVLTGYPLQNNLMEYWCMVDFVRPNYLGTKTEFCNMFERPIQNGQCIDSTESDIKLMRYRAHVLHSLLVGFVQRRSHTVLHTALPQKEEYVLLIRMTDFQRTLYETFMNEVVRTQKVPNPLKAFAVCCKIWNHPDVLYYFLKNKAGGDDVDIDLEEVSNSTASSNDSAAKKKRGSKKSTAKRKTGKPAASVTPYNSSGDAATKTQKKNSAANKNSNQNQTPVPSAPPAKVENPPPTFNQNLQSFNQTNQSTGFPSNPTPTGNYQGNMVNFNQMNTNQGFNQNKPQDEPFIQNNQTTSSGIFPQKPGEYNNFCSPLSQNSNQSGNFVQNPPSNYSDSGFSQQTVEYSQNSQGSTFSTTSSAAANPPNNLTQDGGFNNFSQPNQPNFTQNQFQSNPQPSNTFPSSTPTPKPEEFPTNNFPSEDFKSPTETFSNSMVNFPDGSSNQTFPNPNFSSNPPGFPSNSNQNVTFPQEIPSQNPNFPSNGSQNTNYAPSNTNYSSQSGQNHGGPPGNQSGNFPQNTTQGNNFNGSPSSNFPPNNQNFPQNSGNFSLNNQPHPNPNPNNQNSNVTPLNNQTGNFASNNQSPNFSPANNANTNFSPNSQPTTFSGGGQNPFPPNAATNNVFPNGQNSGFAGTTPAFPQNNQTPNFPPNPQSENLGSNNNNSNYPQTPTTGAFPQNQMLPPEQSPSFRQNTHGSSCTTGDNFSQNQSTFAPPNPPFNQNNFEQGFSQTNQPSGFSTAPSAVGNSAQTPQQIAGSNFNNQPGSYQANQQGTFSQANYPNNESAGNTSNNFPAGHPNVSPSPVSNFQGNVAFPVNGSGNFASNNSGSNFSTTQPENVSPSNQRNFVQNNNFTSSNSNQSGNFQPNPSPSPGFPQNVNQPSNYPRNSNQSPNFPTNPAPPANFSTNPNQGNFSSNPNQSPNFPLNSNQSSSFASNPNQSSNFTSNPNQSPNVESNLNQSPNFTSNPNQSPNFASNPNQSPNFTTNPNQPPNFASNPNQSPNSASNPNQPPNFAQNPNQSSNFTPPNPNQSPSYTSNANQSSSFTTNPNQSGNFSVNPNQSQNFSSNPNQSPNFSPNFPSTNNQLSNFPTNANQSPGFPQNINQQAPNFAANTPQNQGHFAQNLSQTNFPQTPSQPPSDQSPGFSPVSQSSGFPPSTNTPGNLQQQICNFPPDGQQNFPPIKQEDFSSNQQGNSSNNSSGTFPVNEQQGSFPQGNQQGGLPMNQAGNFPGNQQNNFSGQQGNFPQNTQGSFPNTTQQQGSFPANNNQQNSFPAANQQNSFPANSNNANQNLQSGQPFSSPSNFQNFQQQGFWGQDSNFKQPNDSYNNFRAPFNQNYPSNQPWKKDDVKPIINCPIKLEGSSSDSKPKINIISDIKISSTGTYDMKKINILSDIKLEPNKEFEEFKEDKPEMKNAIPEQTKSDVADAEIKVANEATPAPKANDNGIPYDWAIELLKDYIPGIIGNSAKMEILFCIIKESIALGDRLLVFSQSLITLDLIEQFLQMNVVPGDTHNWAKNNSYYRLDGSTSALEREKLINEFNSNPKIYVFLVSTRAGSLGINLIGANRVVVLDASWNPCHDTQAVCRVYRYGQRKPCFVYRLVVDNCLEKKIYDRQINKQGMSDRVVDECNPDAYLTIKDVSTLCWDDAEEAEVKDWSHCKDNYIDVVLQKVLIQFGTRLNKEPFQHESLLVDRKEKQLSQLEKRLAKKGYEREKQAARQQPAYVGSMSRGHRPVASVRPMQQGGDRPTRWIPAEHWQRQGMTAQEMTLPLDVVIPTNQPDKGNIVLKAGQKVLVLKSPKGVYMQLESGKIVAIKTAIKVRGKAEDDAAKVKQTVPPAIKNNTAISVLPQKRAVRPFTPNLTKLNMRSIKQNVPNLVSRIQSVTKRVQTAKAKPYQIGQEIARAVHQAKSETESHPSSSDDERVHVEKRHFNFAKDSGLTIEPRMKSSGENTPSRSNSMDRSSEIEMEIPVKTKQKGYKKGAKNSSSALERLEQSTSTIMSESKQTFQETLDSITSTYPEEEKLSDTSSHASTTHSANQSSQSISSTSDQEVIPVEDQPYQSESEVTPSAAPADAKSDIPAPEYGYNNYYGYNPMQPYPPPPQGYPGYPQPPPYDMMGYPQPQQPQYNYGMYPPQNYPPQHQYPPQGPYDYGQPPPQGPVYPAYHSPYPPQQYPPPPQGMYPPPGAPPPAGYPEYPQYPPPPHSVAPPPPPAAPYYPGH